MADKHSEGYKVALKRIRKNLRYKEITLDLGGLELTEIPSEIGSLAHLKNLNLGEDRDNDFKSIKNSINSLPTEIRELVNLKSLNLSANQIKDFPSEILNLVNLESLNLNFNPITILPKEIGQLINLKGLYIGVMLIEELPKEIGNLEELSQLVIAGSPIKFLPKEIQNLKKLSFFNIEETKINLPPEIRASQLKPQVILNYYFENLIGQDRPLNEIKMLLLGEGTVGKTALVNRLVFDRFETTEKTEGIDIHKWGVEVKKNCNIQINVWDFAGQEITHATHQFFLTRRSLYLLVLASRGDEKANRLEEWLKIIQNLGGASPVIIVCNKSDEHQMNLDERALREKYPNIREIVKVSCKKGTNTKN